MLGALLTGGGVWEHLAFREVPLGPTEGEQGRLGKGTSHSGEGKGAGPPHSGTFWGIPEPRSSLQGGHGPWG